MKFLTFTVLAATAIVAAPTASPQDLGDAKPDNRFAVTRTGSSPIQISQSDDNKGSPVEIRNVPSEPMQSEDPTATETQLQWAKQIAAAMCAERKTMQMLWVQEEMIQAFKAGSTLLAPTRSLGSMPLKRDAQPLPIEEDKIKRDQRYNSALTILAAIRRMEDLAGNRVTAMQEEVLKASEAQELTISALRQKFMRRSQHVNLPSKRGSQPWPTEDDIKKGWPFDEDIPETDIVAGMKRAEEEMLKEIKEMEEALHKEVKMSEIGIQRIEIEIEPLSSRNDKKSLDTERGTQPLPAEDVNTKHQSRREESPATKATLNYILRAEKEIAEETKEMQEAVLKAIKMQEGVAKSLRAEIMSLSSSYQKESLAPGVNMQSPPTKDIDLKYLLACDDFDSAKEMRTTDEFVKKMNQLREELQEAIKDLDVKSSQGTFGRYGPSSLDTKPQASRRANLKRRLLGDDFVMTDKFAEGLRATEEALKRMTQIQDEVADSLAKLGKAVLEPASKIPFSISRVGSLRV